MSQNKIRVIFLTQSHRPGIFAESGLLQALPFGDGVRREAGAADVAEVGGHLEEGGVRRLEQDGVIVDDREASVAELLLDLLDRRHGLIAAVDQVHLAAGDAAS